MLLAATAPGMVPEIPSEKSGLQSVLDDLPKLVEKFSAIEDQIKKVVASIGGVTDKVKDNPSLLIWAPDKNGKGAAKK
jgi:hypothetical protein